MFGLYEVKQAHKDPRRILVVEGYMDVVALGQYDIDYAVAALGTATTSDHIHTLFRTTAEVVCCYDGDNAGREAAWRALDNALSHLQDGRELKFVFLPDGEDPDSLVRQIGRRIQLCSTRPSRSLTSCLSASGAMRHFPVRLASLKWPTRPPS